MNKFLSSVPGEITQVIIFSAIVVGFAGYFGHKSIPFEKFDSKCIAAHGITVRYMNKDGHISDYECLLTGKK